jgi:protein-S-isoprenylcysteine O-methyltransferase Ste14
VSIFCAIQTSLVWTQFHSHDARATKSPFLTCSRKSRVSLYLDSVFVLGWILAIGGCVMRLSAYRALGQMFTYQLSVLDKHRLVTWGPYALVRHPGYTGSFANSYGTLICMLTNGSWVRQCSSDDSYVTTFMRVAIGAYICYWVWVLPMFMRRAVREDEIMKENFGKEWDEWRSNVHYRIIPGLF